jgi:hypothetical protein
MVFFKAIASIYGIGAVITIGGRCTNIPVNSIWYSDQRRNTIVAMHKANIVCGLAWPLFIPTIKPYHQCVESPNYFSVKQFEFMTQILDK